MLVSFRGVSVFGSVWLRGSAFGSSGVVGYAVLTQQTQRAQLRMDATYPIEMPSLGFETLSVLRWHSWTVGAHGLLGRKGEYGAAWADSNPLYGNGEPEIKFLGGSNGIPYVRFKIESF